MEAREWPDEGDDGRPDAYLPPEQRWWRHPSELGAPMASHPPALLPASGGSRAVLALAVVIGTAGAVMAAFIAHLAQPATDDVATPLVRVTAATTALVTVAPTAAPTSAMPGVVQLLVSAGPGDRSGTAAAVGDGRLVTSAQVVEGVTDATVVMPDGSEQQARVVWVDEASGTAVLEVSQPTPTLASGQAATLDPGDEVTAAGTNTPGEVVAVGVQAMAGNGARMEHLLRLRMDGPVDDGAVLLDRRGRAVGICIGHEAGDESTTLAAPIELAKAATGPAGAAAGEGARQFAWLGLTGKSVPTQEAPAVAEAASTTSSVLATAPPESTVSSTTTTTTASLMSTSTAAPPTAQPESTAPTTLAPAPPERGALVVAIDPEGAAASAGLLPGDVVIAVDDVSVSSMNALILLVRERKVGDTIHLTVVRAGETIELETVLKDRPE